jgi:hypothetical protein
MVFYTLFKKLFPPVTVFSVGFAPLG